MNVNLVVMPGSPALVRELSPGDTVGGRLLSTLRTLLGHAAAQRPIELVGSRDRTWYTALTGSLRAWGAPEVSVGAGNHLPELLQRYVLGDRAAQVTSARDRLGTPAPDVLTIVTADGSAGLDPRAPLAEVPGAAAADQWCRALLAGSPNPGKWTASQLRAAGVVEPELWVELAGLSPGAAELIDADTTLGVGRYVAGWEI